MTNDILSSSDADRSADRITSPFLAATDLMQLTAAVTSHCCGCLVGFPVYQHHSFIRSWRRGQVFFFSTFVGSCFGHWGRYAKVNTS